MKDNSDIPLPLDELRSRVLVFAITDEATHQYEEITKGYVQLSTDQDEKNNTFHYLEVKDQKNNEVLMRSILKIDNNFGKQKGSIISWTDQQQPQYSQIALSFQKDKQCDMFWRTICEKIGKSYLQISGAQKLQTPTSDNLNYILQKAKNSVDLVDYNIVHSKSLMQGLRQVFFEMKNQKDQMGMGTILRIISAILTPSYSSNAIQTLLTGQNFFLILQVQKFKKNINFRQIYEEKVEKFLSNKFSLPSEVFSKIQLSHRAIFYRQNVLDLSEEAQLESMMFMICKQALVQIMSYLNRSKFLQKLIGIKSYPNSDYLASISSFEIENNDNFKDLSLFLEADKIHFIHEALIMYQQITSEQIKMTFKQNIYSSSVLAFVKESIQKDNIKAVEILYYIAQLDKIRFFDFLIQNFRQNSAQNLIKSLMKKFIDQNQFRTAILSFIESLALLFNQKKQLLDFFNGTFICSVFTVAKDPRCSLFLANILLIQLQNSSPIFSQLIKSKVLQKLASDYRSANLLKSKLQELQMLKLLKHIIVEQSHKGSLKNKQIQKAVIQSGFLDCCLMIFFKHSQKYNIISSSMLQNLKLIQKMEYSQFDRHLIKQYSQNQSLCKIMIPIKKKHLQYMNKKASKNLASDYVQVNRMVHEQILENQQQDSYLMNDDIQNTVNHTAYQDHDDDKNKTLSAQTNDDSKKQNYLQYLKRMMDQFSEERQNQQQLIQKQPRKIVKTNQNPQEIQIQFSFDLPPFDQPGEEELKDT